MKRPFARILRKTLVAGALAGSACVAQAVGLLELYREAIINDPVYAAAKADRDATETLVTQSRGQLLPQAALNWSRVKNDQSVAVTTSAGIFGRDFGFYSRNASLNLSMALFRPQLWASYSQSKSQVAQAAAIFRNAQQDLIVRLAQAYFDVALAEDNLTLAGEQKLAIAEQLKQAKRYFEAGIGTVTDINEAQARYDTIVAQEIAAENTLEIKIHAVEQVVGTLYPNLDRLGQRLPLDLPEPQNIEPWLEFARGANPALKAREYALEVAQKDVYKNAAAHLPTVDLVGGRAQAIDPGYTTLNTETWNTTIGLQVSIPLFSGGTTQGRVNQAMALREKATFDLEAGVRAVNLATRQEFLNVVNGVAQVKALEQAVKSNEVALYSARKGLEAGMRTSFDVLNAQQLLFTAKRDLAQARYGYVMARLKLRAAAGQLAEEDVILVDAWLDKLEPKAGLGQ